MDQSKPQNSGNPQCLQVDSLRRAALDAGILQCRNRGQLLAVEAMIERYSPLLDDQRVLIQRDLAVARQLADLGVQHYAAGDHQQAAGAFAEALQRCSDLGAEYPLLVRVLPPAALEGRRDRLCAVWPGILPVALLVAGMLAAAVYTAVQPTAEQARQHLLDAIARCDRTAAAACLQDLRQFRIGTREVTALLAQQALKWTHKGRESSQSLQVGGRCFERAALCLDFAILQGASLLRVERAIVSTEWAELQQRAGQPSEALQLFCRARQDLVDVLQEQQNSAPEDGMEEFTTAVAEACQLLLVRLRGRAPECFETEGGR
jgi:hypothetical protein